MKGTKQWNWPIAGYGYVHMWIGSLRLGRTLVADRPILRLATAILIHRLVLFFSAVEVGDQFHLPE